MDDFLRQVLLSFDALVSVIGRMLMAVGVRHGTADMISPLIVVIGCVVPIIIVAKMATTIVAIVRQSGNASRSHGNERLSLPSAHGSHPHFVPSTATDLYHRFQGDATGFEQ